MVAEYLVLLPCWALAVLLHECCHIAGARVLGWKGQPIVKFATSGHLAAWCILPGVSQVDRLHIARHAGWIGSIVIAFIATLANLNGFLNGLTLLPFWWTAAGAVASDLISHSEGLDHFGCGNFGVLILRAVERSTVFETLRKMLRITMVRGAQSAGLVTYERSGVSSVGLRCRVVNGKRTDLADLLLSKVLREIKGGSSGGAYPHPSEAWRLFQGHTRFATSSICNQSGCHPHQWSPRKKQTAWRRTGGTTPAFVGELRSVEGYITHNGDLDFFTLHGNTYSLKDVQLLLAQLLGRPMPSDVDSAAIAGLLDLLRPQGLWLASVRYGYLFGALSTAGSLNGERASKIARPADLEGIANLCEHEWRELLREAARPDGSIAAQLLEQGVSEGSETDLLHR